MVFLEFWISLGSFWGHCGILAGSFRESFWDHVGIVLGSFRDRFRIIVGPFWDNDGIALGSFWDRFGIVFGIALGCCFLDTWSAHRFFTGGSRQATKHDF